MKQVFCLLLLSIYTTFNMGLVMNTHYCGDTISSVSFTLHNEKVDRCSLCGKEEANMKCCKDKQTQLSLDDDQMNTQIHSVAFDAPFLSLVLLPTYYILPASEAAILNTYSSQFYIFETGPPKTAIYIQLHSLII